MNKKTFLVAVDSDSKQAWLLPYTLENVKELVDLAQCLVDREDVPKDLKAEFKNTLEQLKG